ncbi:hypothetical protein TPHA_0G00870 [Tetrapisispora phaffii CBS 4417]|uniref:Inhibitor I9 domain-containing protein n=1 Tax=Tetrapisispora phaffii (strain ATCC 24235 / CBS 4417 / NBRC 1672 / NRRL Y-8282 / UCD 70-5) TaxID=1071381 RepID=G8BVJ5_TETPH|nr:hypothetical protein TPHA_0G00870 [Tetrapisispora phaffii CBS 4417]CCE63923.1 hypothetical protein TPHA_0G00870 [Tetrapisispora phaffii CBS 4417]
MTDYKTFIITLKDSVLDLHIEQFKKSVEDLGGKVTHEFKLIKAFTVQIPDLHINKLTSLHNDNIASVEEDSTVHAN